ncbi:uncharacterized protein LOC125178690 [Hyalella azteca]|uniref:Uncharacterized protein LOC125178690 n=1 Tax=Hyalella azteca TaxID=294128 RepID=A0A979FS65_HYAAZ|nr:uncharacterized protein LOC125178690 [Hyalella azteca]
MALPSSRRPRRGGTEVVGRCFPAAGASDNRNDDGPMSSISSARNLNDIPIKRSCNFSAESHAENTDNFCSNRTKSFNDKKSSCVYDSVQRVSNMRVSHPSTLTCGQNDGICGSGNASLRFDCNVNKKCGSASGELVRNISSGGVCYLVRTFVVRNERFANRNGRSSVPLKVVSTIYSSLFLFLLVLSFLDLSMSTDNQRRQLLGRSLNHLTNSAPKVPDKLVRLLKDSGVATNNVKKNRVKRFSTDSHSLGANETSSEGSERKSRGLTWGEYISKSSEAPATANFYTPTPAPSYFADHFHTEPFSWSHSAFQPDSVASNLHHSKTSAGLQGFNKFDTNARRLDLYEKSQTSEFIDPNTATQSPLTDNAVLDKLAHYLLYGSEETKKEFQGDGLADENLNSGLNSDRNSGAETSLGYDQHEVTNDNNHPDHQLVDPESAAYYDYSDGTDDDPWNSSAPRNNSSNHQDAQSMDMKKIIKDLSDLIDILPQHLEELSGEKQGENVSDQAPVIPNRKQNSNNDNFRHSDEYILPQNGANKNEKIGMTEEFLRDILKSKLSAISSTPAPQLSAHFQSPRIRPINFSSTTPRFSQDIFDSSTAGSLTSVKDLQKFFIKSTPAPLEKSYPIGIPSTTESPWRRSPPHTRDHIRAYFASSKPPLKEDNKVTLKAPLSPYMIGSSERTTQRPEIKWFTTTKQTYRRAGSSSSKFRESNSDSISPVIFTSKPIFTQKDEEFSTTTPVPSFQKPLSWTTGPSSFIETVTKRPSPYYNHNITSILNGIKSNFRANLVSTNSSHNETKQKAQKRTLDLLYHMFVDPTTDENGNRRNTLFEDVIKAIDNHIIGDVVALKEYSRSGAKGQSHFRENNGNFFKTLLESIGFDEPFMKSTAEAFSAVSSSSSSVGGGSRKPPRRPGSAQQPSGSRRATSGVHVDPATSARPTQSQVRSPSLKEHPSTTDNSGAAIGHPHVETLPSGNEFLLTDEFGEKQVITIEDIISSLSSLDEAELGDLLQANRRSDDDVERIIARQSAEVQTLNEYHPDTFKVNNLIILGPNGKSETIPFDQIASTPAEEYQLTTTPAPIVLAAQHLLGSHVPNEQSASNPTVQAAQHLFGFDRSVQTSESNDRRHSSHVFGPHSISSNVPSKGKVFPTQNSPHIPFIDTYSKENANVMAPTQAFASEDYNIDGSDGNAQNSGYNRPGVRPFYDDRQSLPSLSPNLQQIFSNEKEQAQRLPLGSSRLQTFSGEQEINKHQNTFKSSLLELEHQQKVHLEQKLALDLKLKHQIEQLKRLQTELAVLEGHPIDVPNEQRPDLFPLNSHVIHSEQKINSDPPISNEKFKPARKISVASIPLTQTLGGTGIHSMLNNQESSSKEINQILLKAISDLQSKEVGSSRIEASTFRTPTPLISTESELGPSHHASSSAYAESDHQVPGNKFVPRIKGIGNNENAFPNHDHHMSHINAHQYSQPSSLSSAFSTSQVHKPAFSPSNAQFQDPPDLSQIRLPTIRYSSENIGSNVNPSDFYGSKPHSGQPGSSFRDVSLRDYHVHDPYFGNDEDEEQITDTENAHEKEREVFASQMYEQVVKSLPKPIHFKKTTTTTTPSPAKPQLFGFDLPNIFPSPHSHSHAQPRNDVKEPENESKEELKWSDPLGLLGIYDYLPFSRKQRGEKKSAVKVTTPRPISPEKRLQEALQLGNVPPHVSKILMNQMKAKSTGMGSNEFVQQATRRQFDRVPEVRYRSVPERRSFATSRQGSQSRSQHAEPQRRTGSSKTYPSPKIRARKFGPPNQSSLASHAQLPTGYHPSYSDRPQSSHFGVFNSEDGHGSPYKYLEDDGHGSDYSSGLKSQSHNEYEDEHGHSHGHDSTEYDTYVVPLGQKGYVKEAQPLFDLSLLVHNVKVEQIGEENESFSFPKIGDPSKFVNIYRPPPHYKR